MRIFGGRKGRAAQEAEGTGKRKESAVPDTIEISTQWGYEFHYEDLEAALQTDEGEALFEAGYRPMRKDLIEKSTGLVKGAMLWLSRMRGTGKDYMLLWIHKDTHQEPPVMQGDRRL